MPRKFLVVVDDSPEFETALRYAARRARSTGGRVALLRVIPTAALSEEGPPQSLLISRLIVDGVIEAPNGAHFTSCDPDYARDEAFQKQYAASAKSPEAWAEFRATWLDLSEADYQAKLRADGSAS